MKLLSSNFVLPMASVPGNPNEDCNIGRSVWKNEKIVELNESNDYSICYFGHTDEETYDEMGNPRIVTRAYPVRVKKPVTPEKIITAACMEVYGINNLEDYTNLNAEIMRKYINNPNDNDVKDHYSFIRWINEEIEIASGINIDKAKEIMINRITEYDKSEEVNSFSVNGNNTWLDKSTRLGLINSIKIEQNAGREESIIWFGTTNVTLDCNVAIQFLNTLELYAIECYNKTAEHKNNILKMTSIDDILNYNYTVGYPKKLSISI